MEGAAWILSRALRVYPSPEIGHNAASLYLSLSNYSAAAQILERLSARDLGYTLAAAEAHLQSGDFQRAEFLNSRAPAGDEKLKQRLGIFLKMEDYARISSMIPRLQGSSLIKDDATRYALAYSLFQLGNYVEATTFLKGIADPIVFSQAIGLRKAIESCQQEGC